MKSSLVEMVLIYVNCTSLIWSFYDQYITALKLRQIKFCPVLLKKLSSVGRRFIFNRNNLADPFIFILTLFP